MSTLYLLVALALLASFSISEEICDCEEKPKCPKMTVTECPGGRGMLMVPGGPDCSCCEAVCPRRKGERCDEHRLSCEHGLSCNDAGICGEDTNAVELTAIAASNDTLTLGWRGPPGYEVQYREVSEGKSEGQWQKYVKLTESPESNITLHNLSPGITYEARAFPPGAENDGPSAAVRAETGCNCDRPFFKIGSFKEDKYCTERAMPHKPCCALVMCADSQPEDEPSEGHLRSEASEISMTAIPMNKACMYKNKTHSMGEEFFDGCEHKCTCGEDEKVTCVPRCEEVSHNISSKCVSFPDPKDNCCTMVLCDVTLGDQEATSTQGDADKKSSDGSTTTSSPSLQQSEGAGVCTYNGKSYAAEEEFHDGCKSLCYCSSSGEVECAPIVCPTESGLDVLDPHCIDWETVPNDPSELEGPMPTCCPRVRCRSNGSCEYGGERYDNYAELPASVSENCSSNRCFCEFGNVTCGGGGTSKCPQIPPQAPSTLDCKNGGPGAAILAHPASDTCCLVWMCPEGQPSTTVQPSTQSPETGSTNSSSEDAVPETMMIPRPDEVTVSTNDKPRPMTTTPSTLTQTEVTKTTEMTKTTELNDTTILTDRGNFDIESNTTSEVHTQTSLETTQKSTTEGNMENVTMSPHIVKEMLATEADIGISSSTQKTNTEKESTTIPLTTTDMTTTKASTMRPIVVKEEPVYTNPWGNIVNIPQDNEMFKNIFLPTIPPTPMKESVTSMHEGSPPSKEDNPEYNGVPYAPEYPGPWATRSERPTNPFNTIHTVPDEVVPRHPFIDENNHQTPDNDQIHMTENDKKTNTTIEQSKQQEDVPIFLRYPVQEGKNQKTVPQKSRIPQHPGEIPPNLNEFQYQGPYVEIPPSGHDEPILFQPHEGNVRPVNNFPRPVNKNSNRQPPIPVREPVLPQNIPGGRHGFPGPVVIHQQQVPPNIPPGVQRPLPPGRQPQNVPTPDQFTIQGLDGEHIPPEVAQHILWALQGRAPPGAGQRGPPHPSQQPPQSPPRGGRPQEVFFHLPPGVGQPHPGDIYAQNEEPPRQRIPSHIPPIPTNQRVPPHQNGRFPPGPPQYIPGVEHSLLPPELYHLAFAPHGETLPNRTQGPIPSRGDSQPHMTHDHVHLTEDLPLNQRGSDFGRPPPPPRFPEVPIHPQLHPPLHNVGVGSPSDEIMVEAADVMPDSSLHLIFSLPSIFVGLHGQVEISYTEDPLKEDTETWEGKEIVSTPGDLIESRRLEYTIPGYNGKNGLQPNKNYRIQIALLLNGLRNTPTSRIIKIRTPPRQEATTQLPPQIEIDVELGIAEVNATWARFVWRKFNDFELQFIDGVQLRYKEVEVKVYSTTQLLHRATGSYTLEGLKPSSNYEIGLLLVPFPGQKTELISRETLHITTAAEKDPYGFDLKIKVDAVKATSAEVSWSGVPYPEDKYVNIFRVIYQSDSANTKGGEGSDGADGEERSSTFKVAKRDPSPSALVKNLKPGTRYRMWLEAYLTNGKIKKSDVKDIVTKPSSSASTTKQGKLEASAGEVGKSSTEPGDYYGGLVGVSILAALAIVAILILLLMLLKRQGQAKKAAISTARKSESAYDNPTYKTSDHDSTNGRIKNSVRLQEA